MVIHLTESASAAVAAIFNISLAGMFLYALLYPAQNIDFIFSMGLLVFIVEFLSIHSSGMLGAQRIETNPLPQIPYALYFRLPLLAIYAVFVLALGLVFGHWELIFLFAASLCGKVFKGDGIEKGLAMQIVLFIASIFLIALLAPLWAILFPFSPDILAQKVPGSGGLFADIPQTLLVWGVSYYGLLGLLDLYIGRFYAGRPWHLWRGPGPNPRFER